jgi:carboxypeptidase family protein/TonB-dependent receptor-like protein
MRVCLTRSEKYGRMQFIIFTMMISTVLVTNQVKGQVLYGSLVGNVADQNSATVSGAIVTITNKGTGQVRETATNDQGEYSIINILPGTYDLKVSMQGFNTFTQTSLTISANNITRTDVKLKIGSVSDIVSVTATATSLQTDSATVKSEISGREIQSVPVNNYRNYQSLFNLVPGTTPAAFQNANTDTPERSLTTNVNGTARNNNNTRLDGASSVNIWLPHHSAYVPPSDSIQEVNISTNNFDAEQGLAGGAAIQVITKSGTNQFHGSAFAYHDNHLFRAKNVFQPTQLNGIPTPNKPKNLRTIPGATLGGPIRKDKLFFFGSWEGMYERAIKDGRFSVPTPDIRTGNFSAYANNPAPFIYDPFDGTMDGKSRNFFPNAVIPADRISALARKVLPLIPLPNLRDSSGNFLATDNYYNSAPQVFNRNNYDVKINWNRTASHQLWYKFSHMGANVTGQFALGDAGGPCLCDGGNGTGLTSSFLGTVGHTWTLGSGFLLDGNFSINNRHHETTGPDYGQNIGLDVLGIPGTNGDDIRQSGFPQLNFGYTGLGNQTNWSPVFRDERSYTVSQNATKVMGSHEFRFGADIVRHELNHWQPEIGVGPRGALNFGGGATGLNGGPSTNQYQAFAAFLLGTPTSVQKSLQNELLTTREWQTGFYFRDRWQVNRSLTLTLGLRYELYPTMHRADRGIERIDLSGLLMTDPRTGLPALPVLLGGKGGNPSNLDVEWSKKLFAPRIGLAWRLSDETVIRTGYGLTYDPMPFGRPLRGFYPLTIAIQSSPSIADGAVEGFTPWGFSRDANGNIITRLGVEVGIPPISSPSLDSGVIPLPGNVEMRTPYPRALNRGYIQSWNLFVERKLVADLKVEVGYVGTLTTHQFADLNINVAQQPNQDRRPLESIGRNANTLLWDGFVSANYHALQVALNRRLTRGIFVKGAYTWSKAINMVDDSGNQPLPLFNALSQVARNRAAAGYDIPHNFQIGAAADLPFGMGRKWAGKGAVSRLLGGWTASGIFSAVSGRPFTVTAGGGSLNSPGNMQTPDIVGDTEILGGTGPGQSWFDPNALQPVEFSPGYTPATGRRWGTAGRNILRNPGFVNLDFSLSRAFRLTEKVNLNFMVDSFNLTNTPHFNAPGTNASAPTRDAAGNILRDANGRLRLNGYTEITSALQDQRQFRFGVRITF